MNDRVVLLQPAFILQHRKYRESSLIMDVLTHDYGVVTILAKGIRKKKSAFAGELMPFSELRLSFEGKNELKVLTAVELMNQRTALQGVALFCGFYANELVCHFLHKYDPHPEVYCLYRHCLQQLMHAADVEQTLRFFELKLLACAGYALTLTHDTKHDVPVRPGGRYIFEKGVGITVNQEGYIEGRTLLALAEEAKLNRQALFEAKRLMRQVLDDQLQGRVLKSRAVLAKVIKQLQ